MKRIKLITIFIVLALVAFIGAFTHQNHSNAQADEIFAKIAQYKTWAKITKEPVKVSLDLESLAGG
jgi:hypothetical protein